MKYLSALLIIFSCSSCSIGINSPQTGISYKMGIEKERGIYLQAKPPGWDTAAEIGDTLINELKTNTAVMCPEIEGIRRQNTALLIKFDKLYDKLIDKGK